MRKCSVEGEPFDSMGLGFQVSGFSAASGHRSCQFDQKSDSNVAESDTRYQQTPNPETRNLNTYLVAAEGLH